MWLSLIITLSSNQVSGEPKWPDSQEPSLLAYTMFDCISWAGPNAYYKATTIFLSSQCLNYTQHSLPERYKTVWARQTPFLGLTKCISHWHNINRGSYMSAHVLLNLLNKLGKSDEMWGLLSILLLFHNKFNKFNNTGARMLDSIYHMSMKLFCNHA